MKLSIIIVSFNSKKDLKRLLPSIFTSQEVDLKDLEIIVVDNASTDGTVDWLSQYYSEVRLIKNQGNQGFGAANNQGITVAKAKLVFFLNPDTILQGGCLKQVIDWFDKNPDKQIAGCQLLNPDGSIQPSGGFAPTLGSLFCWAFFIDDLPILRKVLKPYQARDLSFYKQRRRFEWLMGAALIWRKKTLKEVGVFDEKIFLYGEEVELCYRAKKKRIPAWLLPQAKVVHFGYDPQKPTNPQAIIGEYQGLIYFFQKHHPAWKKPILNFILKSSAFLRIVLFGKIKKDKKLRKIYEKALTMVG